MVTVPALLPRTIPVPAVTVAMAVLPLDQVPPVTVEVKVMVFAVHTDVGPEMVPAVGLVFTVTLAVANAVPHALVTV